MLNRSDLRDVEYRARLVDAMSRIAAPNPVKPDSQRLPTQVPTIALQTLAASETGTAFWAEGLVDDLATLLGHRWFSISLTRNPERDPATLGRLLDVRYVLSGSVRREENRYRVNLKLTGGGTSTQVWSGRYDRTGDAIDASDAICRQAAIDVSEAVMNDDLKRVMKSDDTALDAWGLCLKAVPLGDWAEALRWARRAAVTYPSMYLVWLELANVLAMCDRLDEAREVVVRVRSTLPRFSFAHYEKGVRIAWRNRDRIVESQIVGLRKLEIG
jgi:TolB-like protein